MKRPLFFIAGLVLCFFIVISPAKADVGPKPSIKIYCSNMPIGINYLDLLINDGYTEGYFTLNNPSGYDEEMYGLLLGYNDDGWRPALVTGTGAPLWGNIDADTDNGDVVKHFDYFGVPDKFKVIVVSENGDVAISNAVNKHDYQATFYYDYVTGLLYEKGYPAGTSGGSMRQLLFTLPATLIIEIVIMSIFRFSLRQNLRPLIVINVCTQLLLFAAIMSAYSLLGGSGALLAYIAAEVVIFITEAILFARFLRQHGKFRRITYALAANAVSLIAGIFITVRL